MSSYLIVCAVVLVAAVIDVFTRRIPNWLTIPGACLGLCLNGASKGVEGVVESTLGMLTGFFLLFLMYLLGGMGAGDVKLLSAVGAFVGPKLVFYAFIWMALAGGLFALVLILYKRAFSQTVTNLKTLLVGWVLRAGDAGSPISLQNAALHKLPYGVAIATGTVIAVCLRQLPGLGFQQGTIRWFFWGL
jgi:prepilin peptidase CpaA